MNIKKIQRATKLPAIERRKPVSKISIYICTNNRLQTFK